MKKGRIFWLFSLILALTLFNVDPGRTQTPTAGQPKPEMSNPAITRAYTVEQGRYGDGLKIYIEADDQNGEMLGLVLLVTFFAITAAAAASSDKNTTFELSRSLSLLFKSAVRIALEDPQMAVFALQTVRRQKKADLVRKKLAKQGYHIPPFMIVSVTRGCNLRCLGCYSHTLPESKGPEMRDDMLHNLFTQAHKLGISIALLAGGEPLLRKNLLQITENFPEILFPLFTNGTLMDDTQINRISRQRNVIPVLSIEGQKEETDSRRGQGVFDRLDKVVKTLFDRKIFFGISVMTTRQNFETVVDESFVRSWIRAGCKLFFFVEYVPLEENVPLMELTDIQRKILWAHICRWEQNLPALFVAFPGDEEKFGGCLSAGRGFIHVSAQGNLEPCPVAPYSDTSLEKIPLKEALQSRFLKTIRENHDRLSETKGGCSLWQQRDWVKSILSS